MNMMKRIISILMIFLTVGAYAQVISLPDRYESWNHICSKAFEEFTSDSFTFMVSQPAIIVANTSGSNSANTAIALMATDGIYMNGVPNVDCLSDSSSLDEEQVRTIVRMMHSSPMVGLLADELNSLSDDQAVIFMQIPSGIYRLTSMAEAVGVDAILQTNIHIHLLGDTPQDCIMLEEINSPFVYESLYWSMCEMVKHNIWYKIVLTEPTVLDVNGVSPRGSAGKIYIYDRYMKPICSSDDYPRRDGFFPQVSPVLLPSDMYYILSESEGLGLQLIGVNIFANTAPVSSYHSGGDNIGNPIVLPTIDGAVSYSTLLDMRSFTDQFESNGRTDAFLKFSITQNSILEVHSNISYGQGFNATILNEEQMIVGTIPSMSVTDMELTPGIWYVVIEGDTSDDLYDISITTTLQELPPPSPEPEPEPEPEAKPLPYTPDETINFIAVEIPTEQIRIIDSLQYKPGQRMVTYYDGFGRENQSVSFAGSPTGTDLLNSYTELDSYGRPIKIWAPASLKIANGHPVTYNDMKMLSESFYCDSLANTHTEYTHDMLGKMVSQYGPGQEWRFSGKSTSYQYGSQEIRRFSVEGTRQNPILIDEGNYVYGDLYVTTKMDEDNHHVKTFIDKQGRTICVQDSAGCTYYVYDSYGRLVYVLTPEASKSTISEDTISKYAYIYRYDLKNRCIGRKIPGAGWETYVFTKSDNVIFSQTSVQSGKDEWTCSFYDDFDRLVIEGIWRGALPEIDFENQSLRAKRDSSQEIGYSVEGIDIQNVDLRKVYYYDNYQFLDSFQYRLLCTYMQNLEYGERNGSDEDLVRSKGLLTGTKIYSTYSNGFDKEVIYYDDRDRPIQRRKVTATEDRIVSYYNYDFIGNETESLEIVSVKGNSKSDSLHVQRTFDVQGRLLKEVSELNGASATTHYAYDPIGRLEMTVVTNGEVSDTTMHTYNVRGWQTSIENDHWSAVMRYNNPIHSGSIASFTGNISEWEWSRGNETNAYSLSYDDLSRITGSRLFRNGTLTDALSEIGISYDSNGNILSLNRTGEDGSTVNDLVYNYDGNKLASLSDNSCPSQIYAYDADGNMTFDGRTGMSLDWNDLGLVEKVSLNGEDLVNYSYLADGTKVSALDAEGNGLLYLGSLIYKKQGESISLESAGFAGGRFVAKETADGSVMVPMFHVTDHLGSVRAVVDGVSGEVVETNDYYPFGSRWNTTSSLTDQTNRFRYNSKEEQSSLYPESVRNAVSYIDYGARQYDPIIGRWFAQDPLSEKYYGISPYAFCAGNPVKYLDPDGRFVWAIPIAELLLYTAAATVGSLAIYKLSRHESSKYSPGWKHQEGEDKKKKSALDKAQLNVQNSINNNFPDPDNYDPNGNPEFRDGSKKDITFYLILYLLGSNYDFLKSLLKDNSAEAETNDGEQNKNNEDNNTESEEETEDNQNTMNIFMDLLSDQYLWEKQ